VCDVVMQQIWHVILIHSFLHMTWPQKWEEKTWAPLWGLIIKWKRNQMWRRCMSILMHTQSYKTHRCKVNELLSGFKKMISRRYLIWSFVCAVCALVVGRREEFRQEVLFRIVRLDVSKFCVKYLCKDFYHRKLVNCTCVSVFSYWLNGE